MCVCVCVCVWVYSVLDGVFIRISVCKFVSPVDPPPPPSPPILSLLSTSREGEPFLWGVSMSRTCQMPKEFINLYACMHMCMRAYRQTDRQTDQMYTDINVWLDTHGDTDARIVRGLKICIRVTNHLGARILCPCVRVSICVGISVSLSVWAYLCLYLCGHICVSICVGISVSRSVWAYMSRPCLYLVRGLKVYISHEPFGRTEFSALASASVSVRAYMSRPCLYLVRGLNIYIWVTDNLGARILCPGICICLSVWAYISRPCLYQIQIWRVYC